MDDQGVHAGGERCGLPGGAGQAEREHEHVGRSQVRGRRRRVRRKEQFEV